jgi:hypothetical protein
MSERTGGESPYGTFIEAFGDFAGQIGFLDRSVCRDGDRPNMENILIERMEPAELAEGTEPRAGALRGVATDGRRLHIIAPLACPEGVCGLEAGQWRVLRVTKKFAGMAKANNRAPFPDWRKIIPSGDPLVKTEYRSGGLRRRPTGGALVRAYKLFQDLSGTGAGVIDLKYLADLDTGAETVWEAARYKIGGPAVFSSGSYKAVVMPLNIEV